MAFARIVTVGRGTAIRTVKLDDGRATGAVDQIATTLESIICEEKDILKVEVDYTGCNDSDVITRYDP